MTGKIFRSTFVTSVIVLIISMVFVLGILFNVLENQTVQELKSEADYASYAISDGNMKIFDDKSYANKRITLVDTNGTVIADSETDASSMNNHSDRAEIKDAMKNGSGTSVRYSETFTEKTIYYATRLEDGRILRVSTTQYSILTILMGLLQPISVVIFLALILSLLLSSRVTKSIVRPINSIDPDNPDKAVTYDELTPLLEKISNQNKTITAQLRRVKKMQEEFSLITENMSEGFIVIDSGTNVLSHNTAAMRLLGADGNMQNPGGVLTINHNRNFCDVVEKALSGEHAENTMLLGDSTYSLIANPVFEKKKIIGAVVVIIDVTEATKREVLRREFTANVSHELKTPLTSISGFAELMMPGGLDDNTVRDFSKTIYDEAKRLISLVSDIIKISELDENVGDFHKENCDMYEMAAEVKKRLESTAEKRNISISVSGENAQVFGVRNIIDEMIYNLCDNAIKYNRDNGSVYVTVTNEKDTVKIEVKDTGIGIPPEQRSRIFERFYRVDKSRSKAVGGTGLGLSIVKHGAMYHNAEISLESEVGKGTSIAVTFPKNNQ